MQCLYGQDQTVDQASVQDFSIIVITKVICVEAKVIIDQVVRTILKPIHLANNLPVEANSVL